MKNVPVKIVFVLSCAFECLCFNVPWSRQRPFTPFDHKFNAQPPQDVMVDFINDLGLSLLNLHNEQNSNNIAISPYGAASVMVALAEGLRGEACFEVFRAAKIPTDLSAVRIGLRDIHRHLKSYFIPKEGFLAGLTLNQGNVTLNPGYEKILQFYGYDTQSFNNALYPDAVTTTTTESTKEETTAPPLEAPPVTEPVMMTTRSVAPEIPPITVMPVNRMGTTEVNTEVPESTTSSSAPRTEMPTTTASTTTSTTTSGTSTTTSGTSTTTSGTSTTTSATSTTTSGTSTTSSTVVPVNRTGPTEEESEVSTPVSVPETTNRTTSNTTTSGSTAGPTSTTTTSSTTGVVTSPESTTTTTAVEITETSAVTTVAGTTTSEATSTESTTVAQTTQAETTVGTETTTGVTTETSTNDVDVSSSEERTTISNGTTTTTVESTTPATVRNTTEITSSTTATTPITSTTTSSTNTTSSVVETTTSVPRVNDSMVINSTTPVSTTTQSTNATNITVVPMPPKLIRSIGFREKTTPLNRHRRSIIDYIIARQLDKLYTSKNSRRSTYIPQTPQTFLVNGKYSEGNINFMTYDTVLPFHYIPSLRATALSFPLDSAKYYLLLILPIRTDGVDDLICDLKGASDLKYIVGNLKYTRVKAVIPSFMLKGYVNLTPTLQKLGVHKIFEPRQADFSSMTSARDIYVTNIEQAITVTIRNYVDLGLMRNYGDLLEYGSVDFRADHPFLYFVMDSDLHVALMAGKILNPLNSRIR